MSRRVTHFPRLVLFREWFGAWSAVHQRRKLSLKGDENRSRCWHRFQTACDALSSGSEPFLAFSMNLHKVERLSATSADVIARLCSINPQKRRKCRNVNGDRGNMPQQTNKGKGIWSARLLRADLVDVGGPGAGSRDSERQQAIKSEEHFFHSIDCQH